MRVVIRSSAAAALVLIGLALLGVQAGSQPRAAETPASPTFFDWNARATIGWAVSNHTSTNVIKVTRSTRWRFTRITRLLDYMTGGFAEIVDAAALAAAEQALPPKRRVARHQAGEVVVRYWEDGPDASGAAQFVRRAAAAIHRVTTGIWPGRPMPIHVDVYVMPQGVAYSLARKVEWRHGRPLELAIMIPGAAKAESHQFVAVHELYHVLAALLRTGQSSPDARGRAALLNALEEPAATLFASCGALLADGHLQRPPARTYSINDVRMQQPLSGDNVEQLLTWLRAADARQSRSGYWSTAIGGVMHTTPVFQVFGPAGQRIELHSAQGAQLLEMCRDLLPDPARIEPWLEDFIEEPPLARS